MKAYIHLIACLLLLPPCARAQSDTLHALFLGNSYTFGNNLPQLTADLASSAGKTLIFDSNTPGGHTIEGHLNNTTSLAKIRQGNWDYVVLQEQSQIPTIEFYKDNSMYPSARALNDSIKKHNPCGNVVFFMTWGRRFGGQQCDQTMTYCSPVFIDFAHMTDSLASAYTLIGLELGAHIAPVGLSWKQVIQDTSLVLHTNDNSHPNLNGSYLAACTFHSVFWNESPVGLDPAPGLNNTLATYLQKAADTTVFQQAFDWNIYLDEPEADFTLAVYGDSVQFINLSNSLEPVEYLWDFGDGTNSNLENPGHVYTATQVYNVQLITTYCGKSDTAFRAVSVMATDLDDSLNASAISFYPNPVSDKLFVESEAFAGQVFKLELLDVSGRLLFFSLSSREHTQGIDIHHLPAGMYFIRISGAEGQNFLVRKLIKK